MPSVAASVRREKEAHPEHFCPSPRCLWRVVTRHGRRACPTHMPVFAITPAGRDALEEEILAEQVRHEIQILDENEESSGDPYDCDGEDA